MVYKTYSSARVGARNRPSGLSDPDPLARGHPVDSIASVLDRLPEDVGSVIDVGVLEVWVSMRHVSI